MKIHFFETSTGNSPIKRFIDKLAIEEQARFLEVIEEIENHGLNASRLVFKPLEGKLWEIKFRTSRQGFRVLYILLENDLMIWLHAFSKKTNKTPKNELEIARTRMKEVLS